MCILAVILTASKVCRGLMLLESAYQFSDKDIPQTVADSVQASKQWRSTCDEGGRGVKVVGGVGLEQLLDEVDLDGHIGPETQGLPEEREGVLVQRAVLGLLVAVTQQEGHADEEHQHHLLHRRRQPAVLIRARIPVSILNRVNGVTNVMDGLHFWPCHFSNRRKFSLPDSKIPAS